MGQHEISLSSGLREPLVLPAAEPDCSCATWRIDFTSVETLWNYHLSLSLYNISQAHNAHKHRHSDSSTWLVNSTTQIWILSCAKYMICVRSITYIGKSIQVNVEGRIDGARICVPAWNAVVPAFHHLLCLHYFPFIRIAFVHLASISFILHSCSCFLYSCPFILLIFIACLSILMIQGLACLIQCLWNAY